MADEVTIVLRDYGFGRSSLVNQFLIDTGLCEELRVVLAEYVDRRRHGNVDVFRVCLGLEALNEKSHFYWMLKGEKEILRRLMEYKEKNPHL